MKKLQLTKEDFCRASKRLHCSVASLKAVWKVESKGAGFYSDGFPTILFERHKFWKHADRGKSAEWFRLYPTICNPAATPRGHYGTKNDQRQKFNFAFGLDPDAAMMACSWGAFQELGENYDDYGFKTVGEFVDMMKSGADGQLEIFIRSIIRRGLVDELQRRDWAGFARNYNGPNFRRFNYDVQMKNAYDFYSKENVDCSADIPKRSPFSDLQNDVFLDLPDDHLPSDQSSVTPPPTPADANPVSSNQPAPPSEHVAGDQPDDAPKAWLNVEDWKNWVFSKLKWVWSGFGGTQVTNFTANAAAAVNAGDNWWIYAGIAVLVFVFCLIIAAVVSFVLLAIWYFNRQEIREYIKFSKQSQIDPGSHNLGLKFEKIGA